MTEIIAFGGKPVTMEVRDAANNLAREAAALHAVWFNQWLA